MRSHLGEGDFFKFNEFKWVRLFELIVLLLDLLLNLGILLESLLDFDLEHHDVFFWLDNLKT